MKSCTKIDTRFCRFSYLLTLVIRYTRTTDWAMEDYASVKDNKTTVQLNSHSKTFSWENVFAKFSLQTVHVDSCKSLSSPYSPSPLILFNDQEVRFSSNLCRHVGAYLFSRAVASQVSSARQSLTSVFGMGTGGPSALITPTLIDVLPPIFS